MQIYADPGRKPISLHRRPRAGFEYIHNSIILGMDLRAIWVGRSWKFLYASVNDMNIIILNFKIFEFIRKLYLILIL